MFYRPIELYFHAGIVVGPVVGVAKFKGGADVIGASAGLINDVIGGELSAFECDAGAFPLWIIGLLVKNIFKDITAAAFVIGPPDISGVAYRKIGLTV